jgi:hypothetical protein
MLDMVCSGVRRTIRVWRKRKKYDKPLYFVEGCMAYRHQNPRAVVEQNTDFSLFTTMRYTTDSKADVEESMIPLWEYHLRRLCEAHAHFVKRDGVKKWGKWPEGEVVWDNVRAKLEQQDKGDYRVRFSY